MLYQTAYIISTTALPYEYEWNNSLVIFFSLWFRRKIHLPVGKLLLLETKADWAYSGH